MNATSAGYVLGINEDSAKMLALVANLGRRVVSSASRPGDRELTRANFSGKRYTARARAALLEALLIAGHAPLAFDAASVPTCCAHLLKRGALLVSDGRESGVTAIRKTRCACAPVRQSFREILRP